MPGHYPTHRRAGNVTEAAAHLQVAAFLFASSNGKIRPMAAEWAPRTAHSVVKWLASVSDARGDA
jgi:hypothetical protein